MGTLALCFNNPRVFTGEWPSPAATFWRSLVPSYSFACNGWELTALGVSPRLTGSRMHRCGEDAPRGDSKVYAAS